MKAISPVIATVIIVAVAIAISIAVALWITGMTSSFTGVEKLEVVNAYATVGTDVNGNNYWLVYEVVKNTGTKTAKIDQIFINNKPGSITNVYADNVAISSIGKTLDPGKQTTIVFLLTSTGNPINGVKTETRSDPDPTTDYPYISKYPSLVIDEPGKTVTVSVTVDEGGSGLTSVIVQVEDENGNSVDTATLNIDSQTGTGTTTLDLSLPSTIGSYTWTIKVIDVNNPNTVYDNVQFTVVVAPVNPIVTDTFSSGQTVSIVIHTASGGQYPATVTLP